MSSLYARYINFISQITKCRKNALTNLLRLIRRDCRSRTGANLRYIMLKTNVSDISKLDINITKKLKYMENAENEQWKIKVANELIDCKYGELTIAGFTHVELDEIKDYVCTV